VTIDGNLDKDVWQQAEWTGKSTNIQGTQILAI